MLARRNEAARLARLRGTNRGLAHGTFDARGVVRALIEWGERQQLRRSEPYRASNAECSPNPGTGKCGDFSLRMRRFETVLFQDGDHVSNVSISHRKPHSFWGLTGSIHAKLSLIELWVVIPPPASLPQCRISCKPFQLPAVALVPLRPNWC